MQHGSIQSTSVISTLILMCTSFLCRLLTHVIYLGTVSHFLSFYTGYFILGSDVRGNYIKVFIIELLKKNYFCPLIDITLIVTTVESDLSAIH